MEASIINVLEWVSISGDLPNPGIEPRSPILLADSLPSEPPGKPFHLLALGNIAAMNMDVYTNICQPLEGFLTNNWKITTLKFISSPFPYIYITKH